MNGRSPAGRSVICTLGVGPHTELLDIVRPALEAFATRHGHQIVEHRRSLAPERPPSWSKLVALHRLAHDFDRLIWIDADAIVVDDRRDLAAELRPGRRLGAVIHRYDGNAIPNLGVFVLRGGWRTRRLLERLWACNDLVDHPWWENAALLRLLGARTFEPVRVDRLALTRLGVQELDPSWNSIPDAPAANPRIVHLAGRSQAERVAELTRLTDRSTGRPADQDAGVSPSAEGTGSV